ncbi:MAG: hypothetical protein K8F27_09805 [Sulfuricellaceae bacterium]|nr:hypothetical protein [Sulfuricellaceae bacterium]
MMKKMIALLLWLFSVSAFAAGTVTLNNAKGGGVSILSELTSLRFPDPSPRNQLCVSINGARAEVLEQIAGVDNGIAWLKVRVISGNCAGTSGWISLGNAKLE